MGFVNIFAWSLPSQLCVFVRFENSSLPRVWKVSKLVFIFNSWLCFTLDKVMNTELKDHGIGKLPPPFVIHHQFWQARGVPDELVKRVICACIREICFFREFMGLKIQRFSWSPLAWHLYTRQLACEPQTESLAHFSVAAGMEQEKNDQLSIEVRYPATCRMLLLLYLYARTNNAKSSW